MATGTVALIKAAGPTAWTSGPSATPYINTTIETSTLDRRTLKSEASLRDIRGSPGQSASRTTRYACAGDHRTRELTRLAVPRCSEETGNQMRRLANIMPGLSNAHKAGEGLEFAERSHDSRPALGLND
jgi:hypothetical protein